MDALQTTSKMDVYAGKIILKIVGKIVDLGNDLTLDPA